MSLEGFQLLDKEPFDNSIIKGEFLKVYRQQGAQLNQSDQNVEFIFGENNIYHQIGNGFPKLYITVRKKDGTNFHYDDSVRLVINGFAFCIKETRLCTTMGSDMEHNKFCGQVSIIFRLISNKDGVLLSQFDNINESDIPVLEILADLPHQIRDAPQPETLINNHTDAKKSTLKEYLYLEDVFGFCETFKKVTKSLGLHLRLKQLTYKMLYILLWQRISLSL